MQVVERDERDMEQLGAARRIVARQRDDLRLHLGRRLGHDVEGVPGAHGWECSMVWDGGRLAVLRERVRNRMGGHLQPHPSLPICVIPHAH